MKFEARRDGMMRKGISDVDSVMTVRELARLIRLNGIDISNIEKEPADEPLSGRSSSAVLAEVSGGLAEAVVRSYCFRFTGKNAGKALFRKFRSGGSFRENIFTIGDRELKVAIVDGLAALEKLWQAVNAGSRYDLVEVMTCNGGCVHGAGMPFGNAKEDIRNRARLLYQADESEAINLPARSPVIINLYEKLLKEHNEITDRKIFFTHYEKKSVLL